MSISNQFEQGIEAELKIAHRSIDSLTISIDIKNKMSKPVYLICPVDVLIYDDFIPVKANYGSSKADMKARIKNQTIDKQGDVADKIKLVIPVTRNRFQHDSRGNVIDVFKNLTILQEVFCNKKIKQTTPLPSIESMNFYCNYPDAHLH